MQLHNSNGDGDRMQNVPLMLPSRIPQSYLISTTCRDGSSPEPGCERTDGGVLAAARLTRSSSFLPLFQLIAPGIALAPFGPHWLLNLLAHVAGLKTLVT
jgi:hypothetical protein